MRLSLRLILVSAQGLAHAVLSLHAAEPTWDWSVCTPEDQGLSSAKLDALKESLATHKTKALLVVHNDRIVLEWYAPGHSATTPHYTASMAKAIVGGLSFAVAMSDGLIALDDKASRFIPQWRDDPRKSRITIRQLGSHTSGLEDAEADGLPHDQLTAWKGDFWKRLAPPRDSFTLARDATPALFEPGERLQYSNPGIAMLTYAVTASLRQAPQKDIRSLLRERIMRPIGVPDNEWSVGYGKTYDVDGLPLVASWGGGNYTARAAARVGRLMLREGDWEGKQLLGREAVRRITRDVSTPGNCGIGWWNNNEGLYPKLPRDTFWGSGAGHQILLIVPSLNLIAVRNGDLLEPVQPEPLKYHEPVRKLLFEPLVDAILAETTPHNAQEPVVTAKRPVEHALQNMFGKSDLDSTGYQPTAVELSNTTPLYLRPLLARNEWGENSPETFSRIEPVNPPPAPPRRGAWLNTALASSPPGRGKGWVRGEGASPTKTAFLSPVLSSLYMEEREKAHRTFSGSTSDYFPSPESAGGWRKLETPEEIRRLAGLDPDKLAALKRWLLESDQRNFAAVVIRHGYIALEVERGNSAKTDSRRVASVSKAICATVLAIASERSQQGLTPRKMKFDDPAFQFIPWAQPLSDPRKEKITVKQLLNHTSGICPEAMGAPNDGTWEYILGHSGDPRTAKLAFDPGAGCGYSTHALHHAALVCETVTGVPYDQFAVEALFKPIGVEHWWFQFYEGGEKYGRHPSHGMGMPARDLARIAYCLLRGGRWRDKQIVPKWFVDETAAPTHNVRGPEMRFKLNAQCFSHAWELPARLTGDGGRHGDGIPADARHKPGSGGQLIAWVPSLDLVVTRHTGSSGDWAYEEYLRRACDAVIK